MATKTVALKTVLSVNDRAFLRGMARVKKTAMNAAAGVATIGAAGVAFSVREALQFSKAMAEVASIADATDAQMAALRDDVLGVSKAFGMSPIDTAKAAYQALSASIPIDEVSAFLDVAGRAAVAGVSDMTTSVDILSTVLNSYGMKTSEASKVSDLLFETVKRGKTTFTELANNIGNVAPIAANSGIQLDQLTAAYATMTRQGISTEIATTQIRAAINMLSNPTAAATAAFRAAGHASAQAAVKAVGFQGALNILHKAARGNNEMFKRLVPEIRAGAAVSALAGEKAKGASEDLDSMANSAGRTATAFDKIAADDSFKFAQMIAEVKSLGVELGTSLLPVFQELLTVSKEVFTDDNIMVMADSLKLATDLAGQLAKAFITISEKSRQFGDFAGGVLAGEKTAGLSDKALSAVSPMAAMFTRFLGIKNDNLAPTLERIAANTERIPN